MSRERELLAECARVMRYVTLQPSDPNGTGSNNVDDQRAYYAALNAAERALLAEPEKQRWQSDLTVDQHLLCDSNRAGKVTIDPTLLSPPTPRSRAEAEAMVEAYDDALSRWDYWNGHEYRDYYKVRVDEAEAELTTARAALLAALTGEGT